MRKKWIDGKSVVLTGASSGIGKGVVKTLIEKYNCKVIGIARNEEKIKKLIEELGDKACNFSYKLFDVSKQENWESFYDYLVKNEIAIDVLINNAGILPPFKKFEKFFIDEFKNVMDINYFSCVYSINILMDLLKKSSTPAIVNVGSLASLTPLPGISAYTASKAALKNFTESLICEYKKKIYISAIHPGFTRTDIFRSQKVKVEGKLINFLSTSCDKMVKKVVRGIVKKRKRMILGLDAKAMNLLYKFMPTKSVSLFGGVMKSSHLELFKEVFE